MTPNERSDRTLASVHSISANPDSVASTYRQPVPTRSNQANSTGDPLVDAYLDNAWLITVHDVPPLPVTDPILEAAIEANRAREAKLLTTQVAGARDARTWTFGNKFRSFLVVASNKFVRSVVALGGGRTELLTQIPGSLSRFKALGALMLLAATIASVAFTYAIEIVVGVGTLMALVIGICGGAALLCVDRAVIPKAGGRGRAVRNLLQILLRIILAAALAIVVTVPITLSVYSAAVDTEIVSMQNEANTPDFPGVSGDPLYVNARSKLVDAQETFTAAQAAWVAAQGLTIDPTGDPWVQATQKVYDDARADYEAKFSEYIEKANAAQCELVGTCGAGIPGAGAGYAITQDLVAEAKAALDAATVSLNSALDDAKAAQESARVAAQRVASETLSAAQDRLSSSQTALLDAESRASEAARVSLMNPDSILTRIQALLRLGHDQPPVLHTWQALALLFILINLLPLMTKLMLNLGPKSAYDEIVDEHDEAIKRQMYIQDQARTDRARVWAQFDLERQLNLVKSERQLAVELNDQLSGSQKDFVEHALRLWRDLSVATFDPPSDSSRFNADLNNGLLKSETNPRSASQGQRAG